MHAKKPESKINLLVGKKCKCPKKKHAKIYEQINSNGKAQMDAAHRNCITADTHVNNALNKNIISFLGQYLLT